MIGALDMVCAIAPALDPVAEGIAQTPEPPSGWFRAVLQVTLGAVGVSMIVVVVRLVRGPALPDRVVALDLLGTLIIGVVGLYAMLTAQPVLLHVAIGIAILMFLGTVAFALYLEKGAPKVERRGGAR